MRHPRTADTIGMSGCNIPLGEFLNFNGIRTEKFGLAKAGEFQYSTYQTFTAKSNLVNELRCLYCC